MRHTKTALLIAAAVSAALTIQGPAQQHSSIHTNHFWPAVTSTIEGKTTLKIKSIKKPKIVILNTTNNATCSTSTRAHKNHYKVTILCQTKQNTKQLGATIQQKISKKTKNGIQKRTSTKRIKIKNLKTTLQHPQKPTTSQNTVEGIHYAFLYHQPDDTPIGWNNCSTKITVALSSAGTEKTTQKTETALQKAIPDLAKESGLPLEYVGRTNFVPEQTNMYDPTKQNHITISVVNPKTNTIFTKNQSNGTAAGWASANVTYENNLGTITAGSVVLSADVLSDILEYDPKELYNLIAHETGHTLGLDHAIDTKQVMSPTLNNYDTLQPGDKAGLNKLSQTPCR